MRTAAWQSHAQAAEGLGVTAGEVPGELRLEANADEGESSVEGVAGRGLPGSQGERVGLWDSRSGQESLVVCDCAGVDCDASPENQIHDLCPARAGPARGNARNAVASGNQPSGEHRRPEYR